VVSIQKRRRDGWHTVEFVEWNDGKVRRRGLSDD
jgi:hypothetical protein